MTIRRHIRRLFVANRGEIAVRIIRSCKLLGIETVIGVSKADRDSLGARLADRCVQLGPATSAESYLKPETVVTAALGSGCDALHPGYGFLAESTELSRLCMENGLWFVGPPAEVIAMMGDKIAAREAARRSGVPLVPGTDLLKSHAEAREVGDRIGYPLLLKASAGGGGRGMRRVNNADEVQAAFEQASAEAQAAFGNASLYAERYIERGRHIEIQILADTHGGVVHLGERDCSVQRRHQKLIEEAPAPSLSASVRARIAEAAVELARSVGYINAGTVEFIVDADTEEFFFLEMNTRIQVEHPVTEMITGRDLIAEQIRITEGLRLSFGQNEVTFSGHAIEVRINAENPRRDFAPSPGRVTTWRPPEGDGVRLDSHVTEGYLVPPYYDSMVGKLIVHKPTRAEAVAAMIELLDQFQIEGIATTIPLHRAVMSHRDFREAAVFTRWMETRFLPEWSES